MQCKECVPSLNQHTDRSQPTTPMDDPADSRTVTATGTALAPSAAATPSPLCSSTGSRRAAGAGNISKRAILENAMRRLSTTVCCSIAVQARASAPVRVQHLKRAVLPGLLQPTDELLPPPTTARTSPSSATSAHPLEHHHHPQCPSLQRLGPNNHAHSEHAARQGSAHAYLQRRDIGTCAAYPTHLHACTARMHGPHA